MHISYLTSKLIKNILEPKAEHGLPEVSSKNFLITSIFLFSKVLVYIITYEHFISRACCCHNKKSNLQLYVNRSKPLL